MSQSSARFATALAIISLVTTGCSINRQLRTNTASHAHTLTEIYEQQVLDNLAMFVYDSNSRLKKSVLGGEHVDCRG